MVLSQYIMNMLRELYIINTIKQLQVFYGSYSAVVRQSFGSRLAVFRSLNKIPKLFFPLKIIYDLVKYKIIIYYTTS